ncbi:UDP-glycosyltransferase 75D1-like protein [Trifolium pratense]|uniref:Glycosyltransferase n=1 Tax=Trifolium pratense TaxID=57577 RepID=A0A2K3PD32_TRIPR|nr:UDP-glycosyltransferase 75D1-like protein [Trifolium pratense]PNY13176.1 UDP-glycosyltransferase 75D1-like protein [Trifolium pratense]PNY17475.1 UDP-glycosyltransferase 75D1-like protein [Trifolium pratense]
MPHRRHRILLIPYPVQGHINPTFQFAKRLIALGAHVTLSTTIYMHNRITNKPTLPNLSYLPFSDGYDDVGYKGNGNDVTYSLYAAEFNRRGSEFVTNLILSNSQQGTPFTCLVHSILLTWAAKVARELHLPTALLWIQPATVFDIIYHYFHGHSELIKNPECSIALPGLSLLLSQRDLPSFLLESDLSAYSNYNSLMLTLFEEQIKDLDVEKNPTTILVNSFEALEPEALRSVEKLNMIFIGPLVPSAFLDVKEPTKYNSFGGQSQTHIFQPSNDCVEWLDSKKDMSVIYISFGSLIVLSKVQMEEIARALLDCGFSFLWVIKEKEELLSYREELEKKGKIVKWCSQVEVLSHSSLGCFLTHCGWNSCLESLVSGVPMVAFPQRMDQMTNAKLIEDVWKIGVRVDYKVDEYGIVRGDEIKKCLEVVMGSGEKGEELRRNAIEWKNLAREAVKEYGSSHKNLRGFLDDTIARS